MPLANPDESTTETWQALFTNGNIGIIDPESMKYVPVSDTEGHLIVAGAVSGNVGYYKVRPYPPSTPLLLSRCATALAASIC